MGNTSMSLHSFWFKNLFILIKYDSSSFAWDDEKQGRPTTLKSVSVHGALNNPDVQRRLHEKAQEIYARTYLARLERLGGQP